MRIRVDARERNPSISTSSREHAQHMTILYHDNNVAAVRLPPIVSDVSGLLWPFVQAVAKADSDAEARAWQAVDSLTDLPFAWMLLIDLVRVQPMLRAETVWPRGRSNASGCRFDPFYVEDAEMYVYPTVHVMLESVLDMYEISANSFLCAHLFTNYAAEYKAFADLFVHMERLTSKIDSAQLSKVAGVNDVDVCGCSETTVTSSTSKSMRFIRCVAYGFLIAEERARAMS